MVGLIFLTFFVISFLTNIIGPLVPEIIDDFHLSHTLVAVLPFAFFFAYGVFSIPAGLLIERYQEKPVMVADFVVAFLGASIMALWDIQGKVLGVPVYRLLGGPTREYVECYATGFPAKGSRRETARACIEAGYRAYRIGPADGTPWDRFDMVAKTAEVCREVREGVGKDGAWAVDFHTRLDFADAVRLAKAIEDLGPYFVEDLVRSENPGVYRTLRGQVKVPIAVGEQFGDKWQINELVEQDLIDYARVVSGVLLTVFGYVAMVMTK